MVDRLKTTEPVSQGARSIRFEPDITDRFCMRQTAKLQYHYYHISEFDLQSMLYLCPRTLAQPHMGVRSVFFGSDGG